MSLYLWSLGIFASIAIHSRVSGVRSPTFSLTGVHINVPNVCPNKAINKLLIPSSLNDYACVTHI